MYNYNQRQFTPMLFSRPVSNYINPFLFTRGLTCPHSVQTSLTHNFPKLDFLTTVLPVYRVYIDFLKSIALQIMPHSVSTGFRALQPSSNYSAQCSGRMWQPGNFAHFLKIWNLPNSCYILYQAATPNPASSSFKKSVLNGHFNLQLAVAPDQCFNRDLEETSDV